MAAHRSIEGDGDVNPGLGHGSIQSADHEAQYEELPSEICKSVEVVNAGSCSANLRLPSISESPAT